MDTNLKGTAMQTLLVPPAFSYSREETVPFIGTPRRSLSSPASLPALEIESLRRKVKGRSKVKRFKKWATSYMPLHGKKLEMTKKDLAMKYRLHLFVFAIFLAAVVMVSLAWYYRELSLRMLQSTQTIFFDPRERLLTLADPTDSGSVEGHLGLDMPEWQLPLHCPVVVGEDPSSRQCEWKNNANMSITHFGNSYVQCYNVSWVSHHPEHVPYDCFNIGHSSWYGPSNQSNSTFPIRGQFYYKPSNQRLDKNGIFGHVEDFYWLSSTGVGLRINGNDPIHVFWNQSGDNRLCLLSNHTGSLHHQEKSTHLDYTLCNGINPIKTHLYMHEIFPPPSPLTFPSENVFLGYFWSFQGFSSQTGNFSQHGIMDLAKQLKNYSQSDAKILLDTRWQVSQGDLTFDQELFPNISDLVATLDEVGSQLTIVVRPSMHHTSSNFRQAIDASMFVLDASGQVSGLVKDRQGVAAVIDVFNVDAQRWYRDKIKALANQLPGSSLRLSYGPTAWLPYQAHFASPEASPRDHRTRITETVSQISRSLIVEHTSNTRHIAHLIPVHTDVTQSEDRKCMSGAIETALTLGIMGYPFVLLEGPNLERSTSGNRNESDDEIELYIRWLQLAAFFPAAQMSVPPWHYGQEVVSTSTNASSLHARLVVPLLRSSELSRQVVSQGMPILRPVWWLDAGNVTVHDMKITDQFLVGDHVLVAPVLCTGTRSRDIYVPPGVWEDKDQGKFFLGPTVLVKYPVPLHTIVVLHRHVVEGEQRNH